MRNALSAALSALLLAAGPGAALAQDAGTPGATFETVAVPGPSLEGNLQGNPAAPEVYVYLPPGYAAEPDRRYPVIYMLHGYGLDAAYWHNFMAFPAPLDNAFAAGAREMIVVTPSAFSLHGGSMYSNSVTTGNWEGFVADDLVAWVDSNYRTIPQRASRGLAGHSMGGYGALRIGMKRPDVFGSVYAMSACCLSPQATPAPGSPQLAQLASLENLGEPEQAGPLDFGAVQMATAAAWSPNPNNPPFYFDAPTTNGEVNPEVIAAWAANAPVAMVHQYVPALNSLDALAMEIGLQDGLLGGNERLHEIMEGYGIEHGWETYEGDHTNRIAERFATDLLPFFSEHLAFGTD
jgi:enterochelin esterase-like enzyme